MKDKVYPSAEVAPYHNSFTWVYLDVDKAATRNVMKQYNIGGVPYVAFLSPDREVLATSQGRVSTEQFVGTINQVLAKMKTRTPAATTTTTTNTPATPKPATTSSTGKGKGFFKSLFKKRK